LAHIEAPALRRIVFSSWHTLKLRKELRERQPKRARKPVSRLDRHDLFTALKRANVGAM
jgi:hypothetical protein